MTCRMCGKDDESVAGHLCSDCWQIKSRLEELLKHKSARMMVSAMIKAAEETDTTSTKPALDEKFSNEGSFEKQAERLLELEGFTLQFGKHKDKTFAQLIEDDERSYLVWLSGEKPRQKKSHFAEAVKAAGEFLDLLEPTEGE